MTTEQIISKLGARADELHERGQWRMAAIGSVTLAEETEAQRELRALAQSDWACAEEIRVLATKIETDSW